MSDLTYFDYAATTPVDRACWQSCCPISTRPSGTRLPSTGTVNAEAAVEAARETVATALNCRPDEIVLLPVGANLITWPCAAWRWRCAQSSVPTGS